MASIITRFAPSPTGNLHIGSARTALINFICISKNINSYDAFIALGCVIKGKTPHFDFISQSSIDGIMKLSINHKKPIGNGIITCLNKKQALERSNPKKKNKGEEACKAVLSVLGILKNEFK